MFYGVSCGVQVGTLLDSCMLYRNSCGLLVSCCSADVEALLDTCVFCRVYCGARLGAWLGSCAFYRVSCGFVPSYCGVGGVVNLTCSSSKVWQNATKLTLYVNLFAFYHTFDDEHVILIAFYEISHDACFILIVFYIIFDNACAFLIAFYIIFTMLASS